MNKLILNELQTINATLQLILYKLECDLNPNETTVDFSVLAKKITELTRQSVVDKEVKR